MDNPNRDNEEAPVKNVTNEEAITGRSDDDENEFFESADEEAVGEVCLRAGIGSARIVPVVE